MGSTTKPSLKTQLLEEIDVAIREGRKDDARKLLRANFSERSKIPRPSLSRIANLLRRSDMPMSAIFALNPVVRPSSRSPSQATDGERLEYAASLINIGAPEEASGILSSVDASKNPDTWLFRAFASVAKWDYAGSIGELKAYLSVATLAPYAQLVGRANLVAALIAEDKNVEADEVLIPLLAATREQKHELLHSSAMELAARNEFSRQRWDAFDARLAEMTLRQSSLDSFQRFIIKKWSVLKGVIQSKGEPEALLALQELRQEAETRGHWETVRDCDRYFATTQKNFPLFTHLFFGTESAIYRSKLHTAWTGHPKLPSHYEWHLLVKKSSPVLRLETGEWAGKSHCIKIGQLTQRTFQAFCSDFYRPLRLASLHFRLYPKEYFNPHSSPDRVHRAIRLFREWCRSHRAPFLIQEANHNYSLGTAKPVAIEVASPDLVRDNVGAKLLLLQKKMGAEQFTIEEATATLKISRSALHRLFREAMAKGSIQRQGNGAATVYKIAA